MRLRSTGTLTAGAGVPEGLAGRTAAEAMLRFPTLMGPHSRIADLTAFFGEDHVHAALLVDDDGRLVSVVERRDLTDLMPDGPVESVGRLSGRTVTPDADLEETWRNMTRLSLRRLAVVDPTSGALLGLLCLKASGRGFCSDEGVRQRRSTCADRRSHHADDAWRSSPQLRPR